MPEHNNTQRSVDVVVVGAGLSGLAAARDIIHAGFSCLVLEARDRVGGKTWSQPLPDGCIVDLGAAWINDTNQARMYELAKEFGVDLIEQNTTGNCVLQDFDGDCSSFAYGDLPKFSTETRDHILQIRDMVEADCQKVNPENPKSKDLDSLTFEEYLKRNGADATAIATATVWTRAMLGKEPSDLSALYFLTYCKAGGGLLQMRSDRKHGGQYLRVKQGTQTFAKGLAANLPPNTIQLSTPVLAINQQSPDLIEITTSTSTSTITCKKAIISIPSPLYKTLTFTPPLSPSKLTLSNAATYGYYTKVMLSFKTPFWLDRNFCGLAQSFTGPAAVTRDSSVPQAKKWIITCFVVGAPGVEWSGLSARDREDALVRQVGRLFADEETAEREFVASRGHEWSGEEYSGWGCPCATVPPGVLDEVGEALCEVHGGLHFVGTETASVWKGYMEGAVLSGERGAREIVQALKS